jgi:hypothetical protein
LLVCGGLLGFGGLAFMDMKAQSEKACAAYGSLTSSLEASSASFSKLKQALEEAKVVPPAETASDQDKAKPVFLALQEQGDAIKALSQNSQSLNTACSGSQPAPVSTK